MYIDTAKRPMPIASMMRKSSVRAIYVLNGDSAICASPVTTTVSPICIALKPRTCAR